jgi:hypothetical protein
MPLKLKKRLKAAVTAFREAVWYPGGAIGGIDADMEGWRRLSGNLERDLLPMAQDRVLQIVYYLYETDPLARRIIQMARDYVVAEGVRFEAKDDRVQDLLTAFWNDPINNFDLHLQSEVLELGLWGEQCYPVHINPINGFVRKAYLDPARIAEVKLDPDNARVVRTIDLHGIGVEPGRTITVVAPDLDAYGQTYGFTTGDCIYFKINGVTTASRGRSDLIALADYLDLYNQFLFNRGERAAFGNAWIWDVMLKGMNETQIKEFLQKNPPPKPGSVRAHNENVAWSCVAPDLKAHDASYDEAMLKQYVLGGAGFPPHFFGSGGDVNRATAAEMGEPVVKHLTSRQCQVKTLVRSQMEFALDQAQIHRSLPAGVNREYDLYFPEISAKDLGKIGTVMVQAAQALLIAETQGWVQPEGAARAFCSIASMLGAEVEPADAIAEVNPPEGAAPNNLAGHRQGLKAVQ